MYVNKGNKSSYFFLTYGMYGLLFLPFSKVATARLTQVVKLESAHGQTSQPDSLLYHHFTDCAVTLELWALEVEVRKVSENPPLEVPKLLNICGPETVLQQPYP